MADALGLLTGLLFLVILFKPIFGNEKKFKESLQYCFKPNLISWFDGEYEKDIKGEGSVGLWIFLSALAGFIVWVIVKMITG
ncbi:MAG: hypothetical protein ACOYXC_10280 [Candidatus Rifleibacteriota bacterium]